MMSSIWIMLACLLLGNPVPTMRYTLGSTCEAWPHVVYHADVVLQGRNVKWRAFHAWEWVPSVVEVPANGIVYLQFDSEEPIPCGTVFGINVFDVLDCNKEACVDLLDDYPGYESRLYVRYNANPNLPPGQGPPGWEGWVQPSKGMPVCKCTTGPCCVK